MTGNWNQNRFSLNADADEKYKSDNTFRILVDTLRAYLRQYLFTPSELRQASMLASTMHECEHIRPLYLIKDEYPYMFGATSGRTQCAVPNQANVPQEAHTRSGTCFCEDCLQDVSMEEVLNSAKVRATTQKTATGSMQYDKWSDLAYVNSNKHRHYFVSTGRNYRVCECGISDVYYKQNTTKE